MVLTAICDKFDKCTWQKMKLSIKDFFSKCDQIHSFLRIWSDLLKKSLMKNFIFYAEMVTKEGSSFPCPLDEKYLAPLVAKGVIY